MVDINKLERSHIAGGGNVKGWTMRGGGNASTNARAAAMVTACVNAIPELIAEIRDLRERVKIAEAYAETCLATEYTNAQPNADKILVDIERWEMARGDYIAARDARAANVLKKVENK